MNRGRGARLLLPALLIVIGALALLVNLGAIPTDRLYRLADLWPVLVIVLGLELLVNRARFPSAVEMTASVLIVVVAVCGAALYVALGPAIPGGTHRITFSERVSDLQAATLEVDAGASTLNVSGSPTGLDTDLFQAQITYSGPQPTEELDRSSGRVVIQQNGHFGLFGRQQFQMDVQLNVAVRWRIDIHSGASKDTYGLASVDLRSLEIDTGASTEDITLGHPSGTVPVRVNGGALTVGLHRPAGTGASVKVSGGLVTLDFDGDRTSAVGSLSQSSESGADMFDVSVSGGTCSVAMDTGSSPG